MDRDQPTKTTGPNEASPHEGDIYQDESVQNDVAQGSTDPYAHPIAGDFDEASPAPQSVRPVAANDEGTQAPPTATQDPNDIDAIRSERYQRYLKDLRAHEEAREQDPAQPAQRQPAGRTISPGPQPPQQARAAQQSPSAPQEQTPVAPLQPQQPALANNLSDAAVEETIERYMETRPEPAAYQEPDQQQATYQDDRPSYLYENVDPQDQHDAWRDDIGGELDEQGGLYADRHVPEQPKKKRRPFMILAALLGVGVIGGGVYYAYDQGLQGVGKDLPVVTAETTPVKVVPKDPGGTKIPQQTKLIYDRIVGEEVVVNEKIVSREEQVAPTPVQPPLPSAPGAQPETPSLPPVAIVPSSPQLPSAQRIVTPSTPPAPAEPDLPQVTITPPGTLPPASRSAAIVPPSPIAQTAPPTPRARPSIPAPVRSQIPSAPSGPIRLTPPPPPPPSAVSQTRQATAPRALTPPPQTSAIQAPPIGANDYIIQVASYRSESEATSAFTRLKRRHAGLLQSYGPLIQRADLGDKGIYFRLRVGPINGKQAAADLCRSLISAGQKGCIVRKR